MRFFGHRYRLTVDDFRFEDLDVRFDVERTTRPAPNNATITITNLNADHRKQLQELDRVPVVLEAGWAGGIWEIFRGDLRDVMSHQAGPDWETVVTSGDGEVIINTARLTLQLGPGATVAQAVKAIASSMGAAIEDATAAEVEGLVFANTGARAFGEGLALTGPAADALDELLEGTDTEWSIQAGELRILPVGKAVPGEVVLLSPGTGLIGSPEPGNKGITSATCLLQPGIEPGRQVALDSNQIKGTFRIDRVKDAGDTKGGDWFHHLDLRELRK